MECIFLSSFSLFLYRILTVPDPALA
jgi:hypothetical protein